MEKSVLAKWAPVYKIYGTLEEKTFQDIVIGNMDVQYVVGNGKVQAVLLKSRQISKISACCF